MWVSEKDFQAHDLIVKYWKEREKEEEEEQEEEESVALKEKLVRITRTGRVVKEKLPKAAEQQ
jgi:L-lactate utilization protein LutC